jgi:hypothetical protein
MALSDLGFSLGLRLQDRVHASFGMSVSPPPCSPGFILVATVSRASIRINEDLVALILQLGGQATNFQVTLLANWCFHFEVSSKAVSFLIYGSRKFEGACFSVHFSLWGNGGPNGKHEFDLWLDQQDRE